MSDVRVPLLLDFDGVLNRLGPTIEDRKTRRAVVRNHRGDEVAVRWDPVVKDMLTRLAETYELVWATTWRNGNQVLSPLFGLLDDLDAVPFPDDFAWWPTTICRKTPWVRAWAQERGVRRLAWLDDQTSQADTRALTKVHSADLPEAPEWVRLLVDTEPLVEALVVTTMPGQGLERAHVEELLRWPGAEPTRVESLLARIVDHPEQDCPIIRNTNIHPVAVTHLLSTGRAPDLIREDYPLLEHDDVAACREWSDALAADD